MCATQISHNVKCFYSLSIDSSTYLLSLKAVHKYTVELHWEKVWKHKYTDVLTESTHIKKYMYVDTFQNV